MNINFRTNLFVIVFLTFVISISLVSRANAESVPVLLYHSIGANNSIYTVTPSEFKSQMAALKNKGYNTITMQQYIDYMWSKMPLPGKPVLITFDDGYKTSYTHGDHILDKFNFKATMFIITKWSLVQSSNTYVDLPTINKMIKSKRWNIQPHARDEGHRNIQIDSAGNWGAFLANKKWLFDQNRFETDEEYRLRIRNELIGSKQDIESILKLNAQSFAYPFGNTGQGNFDLAETILGAEVSSLFPKAAFIQFDYPYASYSQNYPGTGFLQRRITVYSDTTASGLIKFLENGKVKSLPYYDNLTSDKGWFPFYGRVFFENNNMIMRPRSWQTISALLLDGTYRWVNYSYSVKINSFKAENISLIARFQDERNYISAKFEGNQVSIKQLLDGSTTVLSTVPVEMPQQNFELGIRVRGHRIESLLNGNVIASAVMDAGLATGGPGLKAEHQDNTGEVNIDQIKIDPLN